MSFICLTHLHTEAPVSPPRHRGWCLRRGEDRDFVEPQRRMRTGDAERLPGEGDRGHELPSTERNSPKEEGGMEEREVFGLVKEVRRQGRLRRGSLKDMVVGFVFPLFIFSFHLS